VKEHLTPEAESMVEKVKLRNETKVDTDALFLGLINPYATNVYFDKDFENLIIDKANGILSKEYCQEHDIKVDQNKFYDSKTDTYHTERRYTALKQWEDKCYFDVPKEWSEDSKEPEGDYKECTRKFKDSNSSNSPDEVGNVMKDNYVYIPIKAVDEINFKENERCECHKDEQS